MTTERNPGKKHVLSNNNHSQRQTSLVRLLSGSSYSARPPAHEVCFKHDTLHLKLSHASELCARYCGLKKKNPTAEGL